MLGDMMGVIWKWLLLAVFFLFFLEQKFHRSDAVMKRLLDHVLYPFPPFCIFNPLREGKTTVASCHACFDILFTLLTAGQIVCITCVSARL